MSNYIPEELVDLQRYMTVKRWKQVEHHITKPYLLRRKKPLTKESK